MAYTLCNKFAQFTVTFASSIIKIKNNNALKFLVQIAVLQLFLLLFSGCTVQYVYNNADNFISKEINSLLDLNRTQKKALKAELRELHRWHRSTQLPDYAQYIHSLSKQTRGPVSESDVANVFEQLSMWGEEVQQQALPIVTETLASLSDKQVDNLARNLKEENDSRIKEKSDSSLANTQKNWANKFGGRLERFTGKLNRAQKAYITLRSAEYISETELSIQNYQQWQTSLLELLEHRNNKPLFTTEISKLFINADDHFSDEFKQTIEHNKQLNRQTTAYILSNLTDKQFSHIRDYLSRLAADFSQLADQT